MRKPTIVFVLSVFFASFGASAVAHAAQSEFELVRSAFRYVNGARANDGLSPLQLNDSLSRIARAHSSEMARNGEIYHNDRLAEQVSGWSMLGENVGVGPSIESVNDAFMRSAEHRENIQGGFKNIGIGVVTVDGDVWVTQVFFTPMRQRAAQHHTVHHRPVHHARAHTTNSIHRVHAAAPPAHVVSAPHAPQAEQDTECPYSKVRLFDFYARVI